jgi:hypothetical protein
VDHGKPALKGNGRLKPLWVMVDGKAEHHPEARYKVSWYDNGKKRFEDVGQDPDVAVATLSRREKSLEAKLRDSRFWTTARRRVGC